MNLRLQFERALYFRRADIGEGGCPVVVKGGQSDAVKGDEAQICDAKGSEHAMPQSARRLSRLSSSQESQHRHSQ